MAVIATNGDTTLATANGFVGVEAHNLGAYNSVTDVSLAPLTTTRYMYPTFANACNITGLSVLFEEAYAATNTRTVNFFFEEYQTITSFNTGTERINKVAHGLNDGDIVVFTSTGTLPTGITALTSYYVVNKTADDFQISLTAGGSVVLLSGTPSGTATVAKRLDFQNFTEAQIFLTSIRRLKVGHGTIIFPITLTTPVAVTTDAGKYRFRLGHGAGVGTINTRLSGSTTGAPGSPFYAAWGDIPASASDGDVIVVKDKLIIDKDFTTGNVAGDADTNTTGMVIHSNLNATGVDDIALVEWENTPVASYRLTLKANVLMADLSGFRAGTADNPIPYDKRAIIEFSRPAVGTGLGAFVCVGFVSATRTYLSGTNIFLYGEVGQSVSTKLSVGANVGATTITVDDEMDWQAGDIIFIGKQNSTGQGSVAGYTISSVSGNQITLTSAIATFSRIAGATVFRAYNNHGIFLTAEEYAIVRSHTFLNIVFKGVDTRFVYVNGATGTSYYWYSNTFPDEFKSEHLFEDVTHVNYGTSVLAFTQMTVAPKGTTFRNCFIWRANVSNLAITYTNSSFKSGLLTVDSCAILSSYRGTMTVDTKVRLKIINSFFENSDASYYGYAITGVNGLFENNYHWGKGSTSNGAVAILGATNCISRNNTYEKCGMAVAFNTGFNALNCLFQNENFLADQPNTTDISTGIGYYDVTFDSCMFSTFDTTWLVDCLEGTLFRFVNDGGVQNVDYCYTPTGKYIRTGDGLSDTTVHTEGTGKFAECLQAGTGEHKLSFDLPTGDIKDLTMAVGVWCKINSSDYWSAEHVMPKLLIEYDGETQVISTATQTTDWQYLMVSFKPTTSTGKVKVYFIIETEQVDSLANVYFDDFSAFYPAGYQLNLGGLDNFDRGLPVFPPISTGVSPVDLWNLPTSLLTGTGTIGKFVLKLLSVAKFIGLK